MHDVVWTPGRVQRFWDYYSSNSALEDTYFTKLVGRNLIEVVARRIPIGSALDLGCGRGDLIGYLLEKHEAGGSDQSPESAATVNRRFEGHSRFRGVSVGTQSLPDSSVDTVFIVEVVEHLDDATLKVVLSEARRLLKPGGHVVLTTPNAENLEQSKVICPECGCVFHKMQHVRSWTPQSLTDYVSRLGFDGSAFTTRLSHHRGLKRIAQRFVSLAMRHLDPHLIYIGAAKA